MKREQHRKKEHYYGQREHSTNLALTSTHLSWKKCDGATKPTLMVSELDRVPNRGDQGKVPCGGGQAVVLWSEPLHRPGHLKSLIVNIVMSRMQDRLPVNNNSSDVVHNRVGEDGE